MSRDRVGAKVRSKECHVVSLGCWGQGAGERDQSISWDPINVNVSNEDVL